MADETGAQALTEHLRDRLRIAAQARADERLLADRMAVLLPKLRAYVATDSPLDREIEDVLIAYRGARRTANARIAKALFETVPPSVEDLTGEDPDYGF